MVTVKLTVRQKGLASVLRAVKRVEDALQPPSITESVGDGADVFVEGARARAPRRSGRLASSIDKTPDTPTSWIIGSDLIYAGVQEFGATIRPATSPTLVYQGTNGITYFDKVVRIPSQPYMRPTFDLDQAEAVAAVKSDIVKNIG